MLGIILKDYYETFCIKKNLWGTIFGFGCIALISVFMQNFYSFCLIVGIILPMIGCSPLQYAMEQDDISKFDDILLTFPITKKRDCVIAVCSLPVLLWHHFCISACRNLCLCIYT